MGRRRGGDEEVGCEERAALHPRSGAQRSGRRSPPGQPPGQVSQRSLPADPRGATRPGSPRPGPREGAREQGRGPGPRLSLTLAEVHRPQPAQLRGAPGSRSWGSLACLGGPLGTHLRPAGPCFGLGVRAAALSAPPGEKDRSRRLCALGRPDPWEATWEGDEAGTDSLFGGGRPQAWV